MKQSVGALKNAILPGLLAVFVCACGSGGAPSGTDPSGTEDPDATPTPADPAPAGSIDFTITGVERIGFGLQGAFEVHLAVLAPKPYRIELVVPDTQAACGVSDELTTPAGTTADVWVDADSDTATFYAAAVNANDPTQMGSGDNCTVRAHSGEKLQEVNAELVQSFISLKDAPTEVPSESTKPTPFEVVTGIVSAAGDTLEAQPTGLTNGIPYHLCTTSGAFQFGTATPGDCLPSATELGAETKAESLIALYPTLGVISVSSDSLTGFGNLWSQDVRATGTSLEFPPSPAIIGRDLVQAYEAKFPADVDPAAGTQIQVKTSGDCLPTPSIDVAATGDTIMVTPVAGRQYRVPFAIEGREKSACLIYLTSKGIGGFLQREIVDTGVRIPGLGGSISSDAANNDPFRVEVGPALVDNTDIYAAAGQVVRAGATLPVTICSDDSDVGEIVGGLAAASAAGTSCATTNIPGGQWRGLDLAFDPVGEGEANVAPKDDAGYIATEAGLQTVTVN